MLSKMPGVSIVMETCSECRLFCISRTNVPSSMVLVNMPFDPPYLGVAIASLEYGLPNHPGHGLLHGKDVARLLDLFPASASMRHEAED